MRLYEKALKSQRQLSLLEKESKDPQKALANEVNELYFTCLISYLITLHYFALKRFRESFTMYQHAYSEIQSCLDFLSRNQLNKIATCMEITKDLQERIIPDLQRASILAHSKILMGEV